jgi:hypothetical protein
MKVLLKSLILSCCLFGSSIFTKGQSINLKSIPTPIIFKGDDNTAFRDPAVLYHDKVFHLFFTLVEIEPDSKIYSYVACSQSSDLIHWSVPQKLTAKDQNLNYSSPGNVIRFQNEWLLCVQTYPRPDYTMEQMPRYGNNSARIYIMRSKDLENWSEPEIMMVKEENISVADMGRMIDPYLLEDKDEQGKYWCFFKQNGVSMSYTWDFKEWKYFGHTESGENVCVLLDKNEYVLFHSPQNGIGIKRSINLVDWSDWGNVIILGQKKWEWARGRITAGAVTELNNNPDAKYLMFFHGSGPKSEKGGDFDKNSSIGIAWSNDLLKWSWLGK